MRKEKFIYETPEVTSLELSFEGCLCQSGSNAGEGVITDDDDYGKW